MIDVYKLNLVLSRRRRFCAEGCVGNLINYYIIFLQTSDWSEHITFLKCKPQLSDIPPGQGRGDTLRKIGWENAAHFSK